MKKKYTSLKNFIETGSRDEEYVYHTGFLMSDRVDNDAIIKTADYALEWYQRGFINLFQRKIGPHMYEYIACRVMGVGPRKFTGCYA